MRMTYPYSELRRVLELTGVVAAASDGMTVDAAATSLGLRVGTANFKYVVLASRLLGFVRRAGDTLFSTKLGERALGPPVSAIDVEAIFGRIPAFSDLPRNGASEDFVLATLEAAAVPSQRAMKVARFYEQLVRHLASGKRLRLRRTGKEPTETGEGEMVAPTDSPERNEETDKCRLMSDPLLSELLSMASRDGSSWSEARRENFLTCVDALLRELLWTKE